ncbi:T9SS type A sorting domain-containing protein, partial [candidate division WOR-3 bacterium]|nr:T9SS type A sorting domain-containing protein [candidate division WOR-3 bacterium]
PITPNFPIEPGRGYEFIAVRDTTWNPTEHSNETGMILLARNKHGDLDIAFRIGSSVMPDRSPVWLMEDDVDNTSDLALKRKADYIDVDVYKPVSKGLKKRSDYRETGISHIEHTSLELVEDVVDNTSDLALKKGVNYIDVAVYKSISKGLKERADYREAGISHIVHASLELEEFENLIFTVYRVNRPWDVLTENSVGCVIATKGSYHLISFDAGNFMKPWQHGEEVILIIEAIKKHKGYFTVVNFKLDTGVDIQKLGMISLEAIPKPDVKTTLSSARWKEVKNVNVVGYSLYKDDERINEEVIKEKEYPVQGEIILKPVIQGGYETVYSSQGTQGMPKTYTPIFYAFDVYPNPFAQKTGINYALPQAAKIEIKVYDVGGRQVKTLVSEKLEPGYYKTHWYGKDNIDRKVSAGIYFIRMNTRKFESQHKVIFVH